MESIGILLITIIVGAFNYVALEISGDFDRKVLIYLSITPLLSSLVMYAICIFISTFTHKTKKMVGISIGIVFASYFIQILSEMNEVTEFFKYFTVFTLTNIRNVLTNTNINPIMVILSFIISIILIILTFIRYEKKELI